MENSPEELRSVQLKALRPRLPAAEPFDPEDPMALFRVHTLRPLLKMQHDLLIRVFKDYLKKLKFEPPRRSPEPQKTAIENLLLKQTDLKFLMTGLIVGHFTEEEYAFYSLHNREINKTLLRFLAKRLYDGGVFD